MGGIYPILVLFNPFAYEFRQGLFYESRGSSLYCGADCYQTAHSPVIILNSASFDCDLKVIPLLRALKNSGKQGKAQQRWRRWGRAKSRIMVKRSFLIGLPWHSTALIQTHWSAAVRRAMQLGTLIFVYYYWLQATDEETNNHTCTEQYKILILGSGYRLQGFAVMQSLVFFISHFFLLVVTNFKACHTQSFTASKKHEYFPLYNLIPAVRAAAKSVRIPRIKLSLK